MWKKTNRTPSRLPQILILSGVILLVLVVFALKGSSQPEAITSSSKLAQAQLDAALNAGKPTLAFFHSNNCKQCIIMVKTVAQVFPEFSSSVALIDIDVYDPNNQALLKSVGLQYIPTLIFYDQHGQDETFVGVMEPQTLRARLMSLAVAQ
jgi:thiol:disulfide interchange protein